jgi:cephalosporin-C deacetylase-like acetyl esterase
MARIGSSPSRWKPTLLLSLITVWLGHQVAAAPPAPGEYLEFIRNQAAALHDGDAPPATLAAWRQRRDELRVALADALGQFPTDPCPLEPRVLGTLKRDGYRVEKVVFQTRPGVLMTANAYVPDGPGKHAAILCVHGHWRGAKQDPVVQSRCIGAVKLGFFVLVVDAFGAGERGIGKALGEYHGAMTGATLLPIGMPLAGLQVYENTRAVDYLRTRSEVDGQRIGITGASGGGNQSMHAGAWDERLKAVVPVCSVGNYQAYLGTGCCMCEIVPGALRFAEEWGVLGLTAPRGLLVINATRDAHQFSVGEANKSFALTEPVFRLHDRGDHLRHTIFESGHAYSRPMREAMYGWMKRELAGEGDGAPITEPEITTEDPETLRCFPGDSRPDDWITIPRFAAEQGRELQGARRAAKDAGDWQRTRSAQRKALVETVFGGFPPAPPDPPRVETVTDAPARLIQFQPERGLNLTARVEAGKSTASPLAILLDLEGARKAAASGLAEEVRRAGWAMATLDLRATGALVGPHDQGAKVADHNSAQWGMWLGRPLLGQWALDVQRLLDAIERVDHGLPAQVLVVGEGPAGLVALAAAGVDRRITRVAAVHTLASFLTDVPYEGQRLGVMAPGIVRHVGDVADLAALAAPRRVVIAGAVAGNGKVLSQGQIDETYRRATHVWRLLDSRPELALIESSSPAEVLETLKSTP